LSVKAYTYDTVLSTVRPRLNIYSQLDSF